MVRVAKPCPLPPEGQRKVVDVAIAYKGIAEEVDCQWF